MGFGVMRLRTVQSTTSPTEMAAAIGRISAIVSSMDNDAPLIRQRQFDETPPALGPEPELVSLLPVLSPPEQDVPEGFVVIEQKFTVDFGAAAADTTEADAQGEGEQEDPIDDLDEEFLASISLEDLMDALQLAELDEIVRVGQRVIAISERILTPDEHQRVSNIIHAKTAKFALREVENLQRQGLSPFSWSETHE
jgi:hypothetical protein